MSDKNHVCARCGTSLSDINWWTFGLRDRWDEGERVKLCDSCAREAKEFVMQMSGDRNMTRLVATFTCPKDEERRDGEKCLKCFYCVHGNDNAFYCAWNIREVL